MGKVYVRIMPIYISVFFEPFLFRQDTYAALLWGKDRVMPGLKQYAMEAL